MRIRNIFRSAALFLVIGVITQLSLLSCATAKIRENNTERNDSVNVRKDSTASNKVSNVVDLAHDSTYVHDSIYVMVRHDTTFIARWKTKYIEKVRTVWKTDTIVKVRTNTITKEVTKWKDRNVYKEVEKPMSTLQKIRAGIGDIFVIILILSLIRCLFNYIIRAKAK